MNQQNPLSSREPRERKHEGGGLLTHWFEALCVLAAGGMVLAHSVTLWRHRELWAWWMMGIIVIAWFAADFTSGLVHWLADTWGSEDFPILGPRFIRPFRVHHVTPTSFLDCTFVDTNGDTCLVAVPILALLWLLPVSSTWGISALLFGACFCAFAIPTNQIHQWAHEPNPPLWIRRLQYIGIILSPEEHARHHALPYDGHYCITTGFCNFWLEKTMFFRALERLITAATGISPRRDEQRKLNVRSAVDSSLKL